MKSLRFFSLIGMAGVSSHEHAKAKHWEKHFNVALILIVLLALVAWYDNNHGQLMFSARSHTIIDWAIWLFFTAELLIMISLVKDRKHYIQNNWFNLVVIITAMPMLWGQHSFGALRAVRFLVITMKLLQLSSTLRSLLSRNHLGITVVACWLFAICSGVMIAAIDPAINNIWDGIWWAWVTVTTVGYGDVVPVSGPGRILAGFLMLIGMGLFSLFTANFSAFLVSQEEVKLVEKEQEVLEQETEVLKSELKIIQHLEAIENRLKSLEEKMDK